MNKIKTFQGVIYNWNCDHMGHMNVQFYTEKFDNAIWSTFSNIGLTAKYLKENKSGMVALEQNFKYLKEVFAGESIYIMSEVIELKDKTIKIKHFMHNIENDSLLAECEVVGLFIDTELRKGKSLPLFVKENVNQK